MKILRVVAIALATVVLVVLVGIAIIASQFDAARLTTELAGRVHAKTQRTLSIDGGMQLSFWPKLGVRLGRSALSEPGSGQRFAAIEAARLSVAVVPLLSGRVVVDAIEVKGLRLDVIKRKDGRLNIADLLAGDRPGHAADTGAAGGPPLQLDIAGVSISDAQFGWRDEQSGSGATISGLDFATGRVRAEGEAYSVSGLTLAMQGRTAGKSGGGGFDLKLAATELVARGSELKLTGLVADLDASLGATEVKGRLSGEASADLGGQSAAARLTGEVDGAKIAFKLAVAKLSPLAASFDLDLDQLDLDKYLPPAQPAAGSAGPLAGQGATGGGAWDFSALTGLELSGAASVARLQARNVKLAKLHLQLRAANGRLEISPMSAKLYEGTLNGALSLNARDNSLALRQSLTGVSLGPLLKDATGEDRLEGRGNLDLNVSARGGNMGEMKKALAGSASLSLKDGAIKGINLAQSFRDLKGRFGAKKDSAVPDKAGDKTDFSELTASFKLSGGIAHNEDLSAKSPFLRLGGSGDIDLGEGRVDYLLKASVVATAGGQGAQDLEHLRGLTVPVRLSGPLAAPAWNIEFASLLGGAAKARLEQTQQKVQEQVKDRLKGLLGR